MIEYIICMNELEFIWCKDMWINNKFINELIYDLEIYIICIWIIINLRRGCFWKCDYFDDEKK